MTLLFEPPAEPTLPIAGSDKSYPVQRIFCVGRNYEAHAREMGFAPRRDDPIYFTKSATAVCLSGSEIDYPPGTKNCHYEVEFVVAIGAPAFQIDQSDALDAIFGYACGFDMTRRDLQNMARDRGWPWATGKDFENAAVLGPITPAEVFGTIGPQRISLKQNGTLRQEANLSQMIWSVPELIADLSRYYRLGPGDLIYTGTPAGVGPIAPGDELLGSIDGLMDVTLRIAPDE